MGRRTPEKAAEMHWPDRGVARLLGFYPHQREPERWWKEWLLPRLNEIDWLTRLEERGCNRKLLVELLMDIHASRFFKRFSKEELKKAANALKAAEVWIGRLGKSDLKLHLELSPGASVEGVPRLLVELKALSWSLQRIHPHASRRESLGGNLLIARLVRYVKKRTGRFNDEALTALVGAIFNNDKMSMEVWRNAHKALLTSKAVERPPERPEWADEGEDARMAEDQSEEG